MCNIRGKSYTAGILLIFGVIETLPLGQSVSPAIAMLWLVLRIFIRFLLFNYILAIEFLQIKTHSSAGDRQRMELQGWKGCHSAGTGNRDAADKTWAGSRRVAV